MRKRDRSEVDDGGEAENSVVAHDVALRELVDSIVTDWRAAGKSLTIPFIETTLQRGREVVMSEPMLVQLQAPLRVCGDIHGQVHDLVTIFTAGGLPPLSSYLFLGDYVDRGKHGTECFLLLLALKILYPRHITLLRGNHESEQLTRTYGFFDECKRRFSVRVFKTFVDVFNCLPIAALVDGVALCMHGGLSPDLKRLQQIQNVPRPLTIPESGLVCDLLWSDPEDSVSGWAGSDRGVSYVFGADVVKKMCDMLAIDVILRAHQCVDNGYCFFAGRQLVTIFSASNYCGEFTNNGAMMVMDESCKCSFQVFKPTFK